MYIHSTNALDVAQDFFKCAVWLNIHEVVIPLALKFPDTCGWRMDRIVEGEGTVKVRGWYNVIKQHA